MYKMRSSFCLLLVLVTYIHSANSLESLNNSPSPNSDTVIHHPSSSLSIAGDLKDVKLKASIAQLVRALQHPQQQPPKQPNVNINTHSSSRKLLYGAEVPKPVIISSQPIQIDSNSNKTGGKRSRQLMSMDPSGVRTIEGVRVPDDEADKHYTWRNARVIKGFLVPKGKEANPQRKRQVVITDPQAYYQAAQMAQMQGAATIIDTLNQNQNPSQRQAEPVQPQYSQYQYQMPAYAQQIQPQIQQGQTGQMYVMQDGNGYVPLQLQLQQPVSQLHSQSQSQFASRSGEVAPQSPQQGSQSQAPQNQKNNLQQQIQQAQQAVQAIQQLQQQQPQIQQRSQGPGQSDPGQTGQASDQSQQDQVQAASTPQQYIVQSPNNPSGTTTVYQIPQQGQSQSQFVIQPQTYVAGPGGQAFTIPVPIPADQVQQQQRHDWYHQQGHQGHQGQQTHQYHQYQHAQTAPNHAQNPQRRHQLGQKPQNFASRIMDALHINKKALDRMDTTTAVVPALASTGIFLGLSALAAGWYLSRGNREVGIVRRTGKPATPPSSRVRRDIALPAQMAVNAPAYNPQEVDQATFFQSIIQQSLEKTQQQYEDQEPYVNNQEPAHQEPERYHSNHNNQRPKQRNNRPQYQHQNNDDDYNQNSKVSKGHYAQEKSGALTIGSSKNFAKVFIPALILGLSVVAITALIFGWYITGANREIAFLEPASYSRKKRSLYGSTALSDGWLQRTITAIHGNPYDKMPAPTSKSLLPHPFMDRETSKTSTDLEFKVSNSGMTGVIAGGALLAIVALGLVNSWSSNEGSTRHQQRSNMPGFGMNALNAIQNGNVKHLRAPRSMSMEGNDVQEDGFLAKVWAGFTEENLVKRLEEVKDKGPCAKRLMCQLLKDEGDDNVKTLEKRMGNLFSILPDSYSTSLKNSFGELMSSVQKRDCSQFICGSRGPSVIIKGKSTVGTQPR